MAIVPLFDATRWISAHLKGGAAIDPDTMGAFGGFARMWLLFEATLCQGDASADTFLRIAKGMAPAGVPASTRAAVGDFERFWAERFPDVGARCTRLLGDTRTNGGHAAEAVAAAALVLMLSAQRIKETMFYEAKTVDSINEQLEQLDIASQSLAAVFVMAGPGIVLQRGRQRGRRPRRSTVP